MVAQTVTIDRIQRSATVKDVIRHVLGSDVQGLDQHVLFYVHDKREKRIKSSTHLHRLLAKSRHRVHFVVKKRLKPKCQSSFSTKAKLLLHNMKLLFDDDIHNTQKELMNGKRCQSLEALNIECKRRRSTSQMYNIYRPDTLYSTCERSIGLVHGEMLAQHELCHEFQPRHIEVNDLDRLQQNKNVEDEDLNTDSWNCFSNRITSISKQPAASKFGNEMCEIKKARVETIHPSKLYKISNDDVANSSDEVKELLRAFSSTDPQKKGNVSDSFIDKKPETKREVKEANSSIPTDVLDEGKYVMLKQEMDTCVDKTAEESDSAFEDDSDLSF